MPSGGIVRLTPFPRTEKKGEEYRRICAECNRNEDYEMEDGSWVCHACGAVQFGPPLPRFCGCATKCGDDDDIDGPGVCKGLPKEPDPPLVEIVMVPK